MNHMIDGYYLAPGEEEEFDNEAYQEAMAEMADDRWADRGID